MVISYGKKPRKSKSSEIVEVDGLSFFLYNAKSTTKGITEIYFNDGINYPLIAVSHNNEKAKLFINANIVLIKDKISSAVNNELITRDEYIKTKPIEEKENAYTNYPTIEELQIMHNKIIGEAI